jgi:hypothetical protein
MNDEKVIYSIDKMDILTNIPYKLLINFLVKDELKQECKDFNILLASKGAKFRGYKSKISFTVPSNRFFKLLAMYDLCKYIISNVEIAKDEPKMSEDEAKFQSYKLMKFWRKRRTTKQHICDYSDSCHPTDKAYEQGKFSEKTIYFGSKSLEFVSYARFSKVNGQPCIHGEFSISDAANIKTRTGIQTIEDCIECDLKQIYEKIFEEYITTEEINMERLGKWLRGWERKRVFTKSQMICIGIAATTFLSVYGISTAAQLAGWFKKEKYRIKSMPGRKTTWDMKILKIQSNNKFSDAIII